jgi:hypothetical protein
MARKLIFDIDRHHSSDAAARSFAATRSGERPVRRQRRRQRRAARERAKRRAAPTTSPLPGRLTEVIAAVDQAWQEHQAPVLVDPETGQTVPWRPALGLLLA